MCCAFVVYAESVKTHALRHRITGRSDGSDTQLSKADLNGCSFEVVMFDTRELEDVPHFGGKLYPADKYPSLTAVINYKYAKKFGYDFTFAHMDKADRDPKFSIPWHRVFYFADRLKERSDEDACKWFLYLDTDAFLHDFDTPLESFIARMASRYNINRGVGAIFSQEQEHPPEMTMTLHGVNAGVYLIHSNANSRRLFDTWSASASDDPDLEKAWPAEQGVLTEMVFPGKYVTRLGPLRPDGQFHESASARLKQHGDIDVASTLALVNMTEMNSPWGWFVEHIWSGPGSEKRGTDFMGMLGSIYATDPDHFDELLSAVRTHVSTWSPSRISQQ